MKGNTPYVGMITVLMLLVIGIALYTCGGVQMFLGDFDLRIIAGLVILYVLLGKDPSLQPKRVDTAGDDLIRKQMPDSLSHQLYN
jgi:hypothetical protein